jgi:heme/copper-type cytochrome/quinol oxidase subunit 1
MALVIRAQLFAPGLEVVATKEQYNQLFTMHGTIMLLMFATPLFAGFANVLDAPANWCSRCGVPASQRLCLLVL